MPTRSKPAALPSSACPTTRASTTTTRASQRSRAKPTTTPSRISAGPSSCYRASGKGRAGTTTSPPYATTNGSKKLFANVRRHGQGTFRNAPSPSICNPIERLDQFRQVGDCDDCQASRRSVADRLDVVPVGVDHEGGVVVFVDLFANTRRAVIGAPGGEGRLVEQVDARAIGLECNVERRDLLALAKGHHPVVGSEEDAARPLHHDFRAETFKQPPVEVPARRKVAHGNRDMIDHARLLL